MGTDIHSMVEVLGDDGKWTMAWEPIFPYPYADGEKTNQPVVARNYTLFAALANVRNGQGFAGVDTGDEIEPVSTPKGVPADASLEWLAKVAEWDVDMHSHSWLNVEELRSYNWDRRLTLRGLVQAAHYETLTEPGQTPQEWCGGVFGRNTIILNEVAYKAGRANGSIPGAIESGMTTWDQVVYVAMQWHVPLRPMVSDFVDEIIPVMGALHSDPRKVRMVFGFDN